MAGRQSTGRPGAFTDHRRQWRDFLYVYLVLARRSKGLSVGVNLNQDKRCTFSCVYCQINRQDARPGHAVNLPTLRKELEMVLREVSAGTIWSEARFAAVSPHLRRVNDIAFSGDGEPTCVVNFDAAVAVAARAKVAANLGGVKIVVITNSSQLRSPQFQAALPILDANSGEIWAKLDAGSEDYFKKVNRPAPGISLAGILEGITDVARGRAIVIQSLFCGIDGRPPPQEEIAAYCSRLREVIKGGGTIKLIQVHTVARPPAEAYVSPLTDQQLDEIAQVIRLALPDVPVETYCGAPLTPPDA